MQILVPSPYKTHLTTSTVVQMLQQFYIKCYSLGSSHVVYRQDVLLANCYLNNNCQSKLEPASSYPISSLKYHTRTERKAACLLVAVILLDWDLPVLMFFPPLLKAVSFSTEFCCQHHTGFCGLAVVVGLLCHLPVSKTSA
ncbi:hypothetical protein BsWGS_21397 [Bradybaena similaris]